MRNTTLAVALTLSILEITVLFFGAIILGITIHFTIASRRSLRATMIDKDNVNKSRDEWKLRYVNDIEARDKELASLKEQLTESEENTNIYSIEAEEMRKRSLPLPPLQEGKPGCPIPEDHKPQDLTPTADWSV